MALIRATCSECGDVELRSRDLSVRRCTDNGCSTYLFRCPRCGMMEVRPAESHVVDVLLAAGVDRVDWQLPAELAEAHTGPAIDHDDMLDFHDLLSTSDWFRRLAAMTDH